MIEPGQPENSTRQIRKRDSLRQRLEWRLDVLSSVWIAAECLYPPTLNETRETRFLEDWFQKVTFKKAWEKPELAQKITDIHTLGSQLAERREANQKQKKFKGPKIADLKQAQDQLLLDPEVRFIRAVQRGVNKAVDKRRQIREVLVFMNGDWLEPTDLKIATLKGMLPAETLSQARDVVVSPFSISVFVPRKLIPGNHPNGTHVPNSIFNLMALDKYPAYDEWLGERSSYEEAILKDPSVRHENFHSLYQCFQGSSFRADIDFLSFVLINQLGRGQVNKRRIRNTGFMLMDMGQEELLSNIASGQLLPLTSFGWILHDFPFSKLTLGSGMEKLTDLNNGNPVVKTVFDDIKKRFEGKFAHRIAQLYETVSRECPQKKPVLDAAFALFPPSKIAHVEWLVKGWVKS